MEAGRYNECVSEEVRRIPLDRRVIVVRPERIDLRPERGAVVFPLAGLLIGLSLFAGVVLFASDLSAAVLMLMLVPGIIIAPLSAMGLVYSIVGAAMVVEKKKQSVRFQQGVLGLGIGTMELVPFWKIDRIEVEDFDLGEVSLGTPRPPLDFRAWDIVLVKKSGKRISIGQTISGNSPDLIDEGFDRALDAAEAIAEMTGGELVITAEVEPQAEPASEEAAEPAAEQAPGRRKATAG